ncbi:MAG: ABC transporter permease [Spirochaetales bacterium]|nr:ABC transporter permease [Spirochaetales bacterium]
MDWLESILRRTVISGTPLLLATIGEIITERAGVLNLGIEGMMSLGAVSGFIIAFQTGSPLFGMIMAILIVAAYSWIHALVTVNLQSNQVISGLALAMLGIGLSGLLGKPYIGRPLVLKMQAIKIPLLGDIPFIGPILFEQDIYFYLAVLLGIGAWFFLYRTRIGITVRSTGENPRAAESQGVNVALVRTVCTVIGGAFAGMAGSHLSLSYTKSWNEGIIAGRGWIVIALTIFAMWDPRRAFAGAFLFGGIFVLQYPLQSLGISPNLLAMLPYITTLLALLLYSLSKSGRRKMSAPATLGEAYRKNER